MALRTSLVIDGDASGGVRALEQTDAALGATGAEAEALARSYAAADASIGQLAKEQANATRTIAEAKAELTAGQIQLEQYNRVVLETKTNLTGIQQEQRQTARAFQEAEAAYAAAVAQRANGGQRAAAAESADMVQTLEQLKQTADPARAAQAQLNAQMKLAEQAFREGRLAADEYGQIIHVLQTRMTALSTGGLTGVTRDGKLASHELLNLGFQAQDLSLQLLSAASSSDPLKLAFMALAQQGSQIYGIVQQSGLGVKGFAAQALAAAGIIKVSGDAALIGAAEQAAAHQAVVASLAERAAANVATAQAEVAIARAQVRNAATAAEASIAQGRLATAQAAAATTAHEAALAQSALARAQAQSAAATEAASASMVTRLGAVGVAGLAVVSVLAVAGGAFALFQRAMTEGTDPESLTKNLGLTKAEIKQLEGVGISTGDVLTATFQVLAEQAGISFEGMGKAWSSALDWMTGVAKSAMANIYANTVGTFKAVWAAVMALKDGKGLGGAWNAAAGAYTGAKADADKYLTDTGKAIRDRALRNEREELARQAAAIRAGRTPKSDSNEKAEGLEREMRATEDLIKSLYKLATAYGVSDAAALEAEVTARAREKGIRKEADLAAYVGLQLRKAVAEQAVASAKTAADLNFQTKAQEHVNAAVKAGALDAENASLAVADLAQQRALAAAINIAAAKNDVEGLKATKKAMQDLIDAQIANHKVQRETAAITAYQAGVKSGNNRLAELREELRLIGETDEARARAMARLKAEQDVAEWKIVDPKAIADYIALQEDVAVQQVRNRQAVDAYNDSLTESADRWDIIAGKVQDAGQGMADAFGDAGRAIGDLATIYAGFHADRERAEAEHRKAIEDAGTNQQRIAQENARYALRTSGAQIQAYGDMASAAKGFFEEGSTGYKALAAAEKVYRITQLAMSLQAMIQNAAETTAHVASAAARATADGTAGIAAQAKLPFPLNIAAMAATGAALLAAGISVVAGGGGGGGALPRTNTGTGTVLGDGDAQSESIARAIDGLKEVDTVMLSYSRNMAASLKSIETQIGGFASLVLRTGNVNASGGAGEGFKPNAIGSVLGSIPLVGGILKGLFGTKTKVVGSGLYGDAQSLDDILGGGFDASYYSDVQKKKKLFGITTSTKYSTSYAEADSGLENQFTLILREFNTAIMAAAGPLGESTDAIKQKLSGFVVDIGKIDLQGLTGEEIEEKLSAVFGSAADKMATAAFPGIEKFQAVGEGLFETLVRVSSTVESVTSSLGLLSSSAAGLGVDAKMGLAGQFESVSAFTSAVDAYFESFYSKEEQATARTAQMAQVFDSLGSTMPTSIAAFRALVDAQDLTTSAGQSTYATLLQLAPAFADLQTSMEGAKSAADVLAERQDLERERLEALGDTAAIRQLDLAKLDPSNRAYKAETWTIQDDAKGASEARSLAIAIAEIEEPARAAAMQLADQRAAILDVNLADFDRLQLLKQSAADAAKQKEIADTQRGLEIEIMELSGNAAGALEARRNIERETTAAIDASLVPWLNLKFALEDAATAAAKQKEIADTQRGLEIEIMELSGNAAGALEARRNIERETTAAIDASLVPWLNLKFALEDAATAAAKQKEIADTQRGLEIEIMELSGNAAGALEARRNIERETTAAIDASLVPWLNLKFALEDAATAAAKQKQIADTRRDIEIDIMELSGDTTGALEARRNIEREATAAIDASLVPLLDFKFAMQDVATAAADAKRISDEGYGLETKWLQLIGDTVTLRERELQTLDPANRAKQLAIWEEEDRQAAVAASQEKAEQASKAYADAVADQAKKVEDARNQLIAVHERETSALRASADELRDFSTTMRDLRENLTAGLSTGAGYASTRARFMSTASAAGRLDEAAMGRFVSDAQAFREAAASNAASAVDYDRDIAVIAREAFKLEELTAGKASAAERQVAAMDAQLKTALGVDALNEKAITFSDALKGFIDTQAIVIPDFTSTVASGIEVLADKMQESISTSTKQGEDRKSESISLAGQVSDLKALLERVIRNNRLMIGADEDLPVKGSVDVPNPVTIGNTTANRVPVTTA